MIENKKIRAFILITITFSGFVFSIVLAQPSSFKNTSPQIYFDDFEALSGERFLITQQSGEMLAQIYNVKEKKVEQDLIRSGRGPFELEFMGGMAFDWQTKKLYAADLQNGKIVSFDDQGSSLKERQLNILYPWIMDAFRNQLLATSIAMTGEGMPNRNRYPIAFLLNPNTLELTDTLFFDLDELKLEQIKDFNNTDTFRFTPLVTFSFKKGLYLVVFESFNRIFLINKSSKLIDVTAVNLNNIETPKIVKHPEFGYGQRIYSMMNDFMRKGEKIYFAFGHSSKDLGNGIVEVTINDRNKLLVQKHTLNTEWEPTDYMNPFKVTSDNKTIYGADGIDIIPLSFD
jgi:hypothetical protein